MSKFQCGAGTTTYASLLVPLNTMYRIWQQELTFWRRKYFLNFSTPCI